MAISKCEPSIGSSLAGVTPASRRFTSANAVVTVFYAPNTPIAARSRRAFYISLPLSISTGSATQRAVTLASVWFPHFGLEVLRD